MRTQLVGDSRFAAPRWAFFRLILGWLQMIGAAAAFMLLLQSGVTRTAVGVVVATGLLTILSRVLFRARR